MKAHSHDSNDRSHDHIWMMDKLDRWWAKRVQIPYNFNGKYVMMEQWHDATNVNLIMVRAACVDIYRFGFLVSYGQVLYPHNMYVILKRRVRSVQSQVPLKCMWVSLMCPSFMSVNAYNVPRMFWEHQNEVFVVPLMCHHVVSLSDRPFVIGVIAICDWFASLTSWITMLIALRVLRWDLLRLNLKSMEYNMHIFPSSSLGDLWQMDVSKQWAVIVILLKCFKRLSVLELHRTMNDGTLRSFMNCIGFWLRIWMWIVVRCWI